MVKMKDMKFSSFVRIMDDDEYTTDDAEREGRHILREQLADQLVAAKTEVIRKPHHTELRIELYCFTADELAAEIHGMARELAKRLYK